MLGPQSSLLGLGLLLVVAAGVAAIARGRGASPGLWGSLTIFGFLIISTLLRARLGPESLAPNVASWAWVGAIALYLRFVHGSSRTQPGARWVCSQCNWLNAHYSVICEACEVPFGETPRERASNRPIEDERSGVAKNPYRAPGSTDDVELAFAFQKYRPANTLVTWLTVLLAAEAFLQLATFASELAITKWYPTLFSQEEFQTDNEAMLALSYFSLAFLLFLESLIATVVFFVWVFRANDDASTLGAEGMETSPGWAVAWFFIPLFNLFRPYLAVAEIYQASDPDSHGRDWVAVRVPWLLLLWWIAWLGSLITTLAQQRIPGISTGAVMLGILSSVLTLVVVRQIHARQKEKGRRMERNSREHEAETIRPARSESGP